MLPKNLGFTSFPDIYYSLNFKLSSSIFQSLSVRDRWHQTRSPFFLYSYYTIKTIHFLEGYLLGHYYGWPFILTQYHQVPSSTALVFVETVPYNRYNWISCSTWVTGGLRRELKSYRYIVLPDRAPPLQNLGKYFLLRLEANGECEWNGEENHWKRRTLMSFIVC